MDIRLRIFISMGMAVVAGGHFISTQGHYFFSFLAAIMLAILHYVWLMNGEEFKLPLTPLYITLDSLDIIPI